MDTRTALALLGHVCLLGVYVAVVLLTAEGTLQMYTAH